MNKTIKWVIFYNCLLHRTVTIRYVRKCEECFIIQQIFIRKKLKKLTFLIRNFHKNCPFQLNGIANKIIRLFPRPGFVCVCLQQQSYNIQYSQIVSKPPQVIYDIPLSTFLPILQVYYRYTFENQIVTIQYLLHQLFSSG